MQCWKIPKSCFSILSKTIFKQMADQTINRTSRSSTTWRNPSHQPDGFRRDTTYELAKNSLKCEGNRRMAWPSNSEGTEGRVLHYDNGDHTVYRYITAYFRPFYVYSNLRGYPKPVNSVRSQSRSITFFQ